MNKKICICLCVGLLLPLTSCFATEQPISLYGFWEGLWHGLIIIVSGIAKLIDHFAGFGWGIEIFSWQNEGVAYWLGFLLGVIVNLGWLSGMFAKARRKR